MWTIAHSRYLWVLASDWQQWRPRRPPSSSCTCRLSTSPTRSTTSHRPCLRSTSDHRTPNVYRRCFNIKYLNTKIAIFQKYVIIFCTKLSSFLTSALFLAEFTSPIYANNYRTSFCKLQVDRNIWLFDFKTGSPFLSRRLPFHVNSGFCFIQLLIFNVQPT